jgi:glyoxalase family protein
MKLNGLHHVTAIAGDPQKNVDFYVGVLGLRLVKKTVNFDDPGTYHLYYGDHVGTPGTIVTFFPWPKARQGRPGVGQATRIAFQAPRGSLDYWQARLAEKRIRFTPTAQRFDRRYLQFHDPDGVALEIVETEHVRVVQPWAGSDVPPERALCGFDGVTLTLDGYQRTSQLLTEMMGARFIGAEGDCFRHELGDSPQIANIDLVCQPAGSPGSSGMGLIHHIAWNTPSDEDEAEWLEKLGGAGFNTSPVMDRHYFHSIYYREPGNVLFEIATALPGFAVDEPTDSMGEKLMLPDWLEPHRSALEAQLPTLRTPVTL